MAEEDHQRRLGLGRELVRAPRSHRRGTMASLSGNLATMLPGVPHAITAKFAHPDRTAIALVGDGAMQMLDMNELS